MIRACLFCDSAVERGVLCNAHRAHFDAVAPKGAKRSQGANHSGKPEGRTSTTSSPPVCLWHSCAARAVEGDLYCAKHGERRRTSNGAGGERLYTAKQAAGLCVWDDCEEPASERDHCRQHAPRSEAAGRSKPNAELTTVSTRPVGKSRTAVLRKNLRPIELTLEEEQRFWSLVEKTDSCWTWRGLHSKRVPLFVCYQESGHTKNYQARRVMFVLDRGRSIERGKIVLNTCLNFSCINPAHLVEGTDADAEPLKRQRGTDNRGEKSGQTHMTWSEVRQIRQLVHEGVQMKQLAARFGVSTGTISQIARGERWKDEGYGEHTFVGRFNRGERHPRAKLTWTIVNAIRDEFRKREKTQGEIAEMFGVKKSAVVALNANKTWRVPNKDWQLPRGGVLRKGAKLTWNHVREIRRRLATTRISADALGREYGVRGDTIGCIYRNETWYDAEWKPNGPKPYPRDRRSHSLN